MRLAPTDPPPMEASLVETTLIGSEAVISTASSKPSTPDQEPLDVGVEDSSLLLDDVVLDLYLKGALDKPVMEELTSPESNTDNGMLLLDNHLLNDFTDLDCLLDPTWTNSPAIPLASPSSESNSPELDLFKEGLVTKTSLSLSLPSSPANDSLSKRERCLSQDGSGRTEQPPSKVSKDLRYLERRRKNNLASKVSRAKRRNRSATLFKREKALEEENALLRVKVKEMTKECEKLREMLVGRLAQ